MYVKGCLTERLWSKINAKEISQENGKKMRKNKELSVQNNVNFSKYWISLKEKQSNTQYILQYLITCVVS